MRPTAVRFISFAAKARLPEKPVIDTARETVEAFQTLWATEKAHLNLAKAVINAIDDHIRELEWKAERTKRQNQFRSG